MKTQAQDTTLNKRFWEIDFLRGIAIISMIVFHFVFDLNYFQIINYKPNIIFAYIIASIFLILVGISYTISYNRNTNWKHHIKRGLKVFSWGIIITIITYLTFPDNVIIFGILHLIGLSIIISYPLVKEKYMFVDFILGLSIIIIGFFLLPYIKPPFPTFDYFPLVPWIGLVLLGIFIGKKLYPKGKRKYGVKEKSNIVLNFFSFLGRNSLLIYLLHQPILVGAFFLSYI